MGDRTKRGPGGRNSGNNADVERAAAAIDGERAVLEIVRLVREALPWINPIRHVTRDGARTVISAGFLVTVEAGVRPVAVEAGLRPPDVFVSVTDAGTVVGEATGTPSDAAALAGHAVALVRNTRLVRHVFFVAAEDGVFPGVKAEETIVANHDLTSFQVVGPKPWPWVHCPKDEIVAAAMAGKLRRVGGTP